MFHVSIESDTKHETLVSQNSITERGFYDVQQQEKA
ncbi:hypothetical protein ACUXQE_001722 [Staphylococcus saprophyticus]